MDLRTYQANGEPWDFSEKADRVEAETLIEVQKPTWVIGSPPCTKYSSWQNVNYRDLNDEENNAHREEGRVHLRFAARLYRRQICAARTSKCATSWKEPSMRAIRHLPEVNTSKCDQCMYGRRTVGTANSPPMYGKKATRFISNSSAMLSQLGRRCDGGHEHKQLRGKDLAEAAFYPAELVHAIVRGMNLTHGADLMKSLIDDKCDPADPKFLCSASRIRRYGTESQVLGTCQTTTTMGKRVTITYNALNFEKKSLLR